MPFHKANLKMDKKDIDLHADKDSRNLSTDVEWILYYKHIAVAKICTESWFIGEKNSIKKQNIE